MADVLVVGAGPVGLTLACELARHGIRSRIIDRLAEPSPYCRAIGVTPRTLEVWDDMGLARQMIDAGLWLTGMRSIIHGQPPTDIMRDLADLPYATLGLPQYETERVLTRHLAQHGITIERGVGLTALDQDGQGVTVRLADAAGRGETARFRYVAGCDGAHSAVRHALGIAFEGDALPMTFMLGDVRVASDLPYGMTMRALRLHENAAPDVFVAIPLPEHGRYRVSMIAPEALAPPRGTAHGIQTEVAGPDLAQLQAVADDLLPDRPVLSDLRWSSIFRISMRLAARYGTGRVFIAGDAAHIHPPTGGQGMNTGIQDAYNLAWKLALVMQGASPDSLLDSYEAERRPVGSEVVGRTSAATLQIGRETRGASDRLADTQLLVSYRGSGLLRDDAEARGDTHPAPGDRAPDVAGLRRQGIGFPLRLFDMLRGTDHVLIVHLPPGSEAGALEELSTATRGWRAWLGEHLRVVAIAGTAVADAAGVAMVQDAAGQFGAAYGAAAGAVLVRPDGYIAWREPSWRHPGLQAALGLVFCPPAGGMGGSVERH